MGRTGDRWFFGTDSVSNSGGRGPARDVWRAVLSLRADVCLLYAAFPSPDMTFSGSREAREVQGSPGSPGKLGKSREAREVEGNRDELIPSCPRCIPASLCMDHLLPQPPPIPSTQAVLHETQTAARIPHLRAHIASVYSDRQSHIMQGSRAILPKR
jgi:hypothetical protein